MIDDSFTKKCCMTCYGKLFPCRSLHRLIAAGLGLDEKVRPRFLSDIFLLIVSTLNLASLTSSTLLLHAPLEPSNRILLYLLLSLCQLNPFPSVFNGWTLITSTHSLLLMSTMGQTKIPNAVTDMVTGLTLRFKLLRDWIKTAANLDPVA